ncbi:hypothetical protein QFZ75_006190 [Streptomyces sp. V3I8]|nr:hypothetical protein [Streptomyces sp. V3I8]
MTGRDRDGLCGPAARARGRRAPTRQDAVGRTPREHRAVLGAPRGRDADAAGTRPAGCPEAVNGAVIRSLPHPRGLRTPCAQAVRLGRT